MTDNVAFVDLPREMYPFTVEFIGEESGETLETKYIEGPGTFDVPGRDFWGEPVWVRMSFANGDVQESHYKGESDG